MVPLYSIGTFDLEANAFMPHSRLSVACLNITRSELRQAIRELRACGYSCHRYRDVDGSHWDNDSSVRIERTDGRDPSVILDSWKR